MHYYGKPVSIAQQLRTAELKRIRAAKREKKQANYHANGLNGPRARGRRARQLNMAA
jgi:hypothetical protein